MPPSHHYWQLSPPLPSPFMVLLQFYTNVSQRGGREGGRSIGFCINVLLLSLLRPIIADSFTPSLCCPFMVLLLCDPKGREGKGMGVKIVWTLNASHSTLPFSRISFFPFSSSFWCYSTPARTERGGKVLVCLSYTTTLPLSPLLLFPLLLLLLTPVCVC